MKNGHRGFTLVEIMIVVAIIALLAAIAIPNLLRSRIMANESSAVASLRTIVSAAHTFRAQNPSGYPQNLTVMVVNPPYIDPVLGAGEKHGYLFGLDGNAAGFTATAVPKIPHRTGERRFFVDTSGVIRYNLTGDATIADDPLS